MALPVETDIVRILEETQRAIQSNMDARRVNASGRTRASIRVETYDGGVRLIGGNNATHVVQDYPSVRGTLETGDTAPIPTLEVGRAGGRVPRGFYYILREWSRDKGITFASESERGTFAYFLARKIAKSGTLRARNNVDVYSSPVNQAVQRINTILHDDLAQTVRSALGGSASVTSMPTHF